MSNTKNPRYARIQLTYLTEDGERSVVQYVGLVKSMAISQTRPPYYPDPDHYFPSPADSHMDLSLGGVRQLELPLVEAADEPIDWQDHVEESYLE